MHLIRKLFAVLILFAVACSDSPDYPPGATVDPLARAPGLHLEEWQTYRNEARRWGRDTLSRYASEGRFELDERPLSREEDWCFESYLEDASIKKDLAVLQTRYPNTPSLWARFATTLKWLRNFQDKRCDGPETERVASIVEAMVEDAEAGQKRVQAVVRAKAFWAALEVYVQTQRMVPGTPAYNARQLYYSIMDPEKADPSTRRATQAALSAVGMMLLRNPGLTPAQAAQGLFLAPMPGEDERE